jgi:hypothetical protein
MRAGAALLLAVAAFVAGILAGRFAAPAGTEPPRAPPRGAVAGGAVSPESSARDQEGDERRAVARGASLPREPAEPRDSPDEDQPLDPGIDFADWDGAEFARWYAVHKKAWDLPDIDERDLARFGGRLLALDRIPRRDLLVRLLQAFREWDADVDRAGLENAAWAEAHAGAPKDDPGWEACRDRMRDVHQRLFGALHRELAYADYLILTTNIASNMSLDAELRPPRSAAEAYERAAAIARNADRFERWYRSYAPLLGFPERDEDFLYAFYRHIVVPLGRLPEPGLMRTLQEVYAPLHARLTSGEDWEDAVRMLFAALDRVLTLLDYERVRHSHEWDRYPEVVPPPTER